MILPRIVLCSSLALSSCATILNGSSDIITINSLEPGTTIFVDGQARGRGAVSVDVARGKKHVIRGEREGFEPVEMQTSTSFDFTSLLGIFIDFGIISIPIDLISGNAFKASPRTYTINPQVRSDEYYERAQ